MPRMLPLGRFAIAAAAASLLLAACGDSTSPPRPTTLAAVSSVQAVGTVGEILSEPLTVRVTDAGGSPVARVPVTFTVAEGGGSLSRTLDSTDASGVARTSWRLGETAGAQRVTAVAAGLSGTVEFLAIARAGAPASIAIAAGDNQTAAAGAPVPTPPAVRIRDRFNNPVAGVSVFFSVSSGGGSVGGAGAVTNPDGIATVGEWRLGPAVGVNRLTALAVVNGVAGNPVTFTATGTAGAPATASAATPTTLTGTVGTLVTPVPAIRVVDANGNPIAGVQVTFIASVGSTVVNGSRTTNTSGIASPDGWQLGTTVGSYTLTATASGLPAVVFSAQARAGAAATMTIVAGNNQTAAVGTTLPIDPAVRITDQLGNPISGQEVFFEVTTGGGSAVARRPVTDANGVATVGAWTLGDVPGANTLRATATGLVITGSPATFTATAIPGAPSTVNVFTGNNQTAQVNTAVPVPPSVQVRDSRGNPVPNIQVLFVVGTGGGTVTGASATTNNNGVAGVGSWTLGNVVGVQTLLARVGNLPDAVISATATPGVPANVEAVSDEELGPFVVSEGLSVPLANRPRVRVTDAAGNPLRNVRVTFEVVDNEAADGEVSGASQDTDANGQAVLGGWLLPTRAGIARVRARVEGLDETILFRVTLRAATASTIALVSVSPTDENVVVSSLVTVVVEARDRFGNPVSGAGITAVANQGDASGGTTQSNGRASVFWNVGGTVAAGRQLTIGLIDTSVTIVVTKNVVAAP